MDGRYSSWMNQRCSIFTKSHFAEKSLGWTLVDCAVGRNVAKAGMDRSVAGGGGWLLCRAWPRVRRGHGAALGPSLSGFGRRCGDGWWWPSWERGRQASFSRIPSGAVGPCAGRVCDVSMGQCQMPKEVLIPARIKCIRVRMNQAKWHWTGRRSRVFAATRRPTCLQPRY